MPASSGRNGRPHSGHRASFTPALVGRSAIPYIRLAQGVFGVGVVVTWVYLWVGFRCYLKVPHGWAVAAACLLIG